MFKKLKKGVGMNKNKINWNLYKAYKDKGLTAKKLCEKTGIDYYRFSRLINGQLKKWRKNQLKLLIMSKRIVLLCCLFQMVANWFVIMH